MAESHRNAGVKLPPAESERLLELEDMIGSGLRTFWSVGAALLEIRERRLYRAAHRTFEEYLRVRWEISEQHGYRLMGAAQVVNSLVDSSSPTGEVLPTSERQARPLAGLPPDVQQAAWSKAVGVLDGQQPTAADVEAAVQEAVCALPPERQRQLVEREEREVLDRSRQRQEQRRRDGERELFETMQRGHAKLRKQAQRAVGMDEYLALLDQLDRALEHRKEAAV